MNSFSEPNKSPTAPCNIIDEDNIKANLKVPKAETPSSLLHNLTYLTFGILFTIIAFLLFEDKTHSQVNGSIRKDFSLYSPSFDSIKDKPSFFAWLKEFTSYTYQNLDDNEPSITIAKVNNFVSDIRLVQRRIKLKDGVSVFKNKDWRVWAGKGFSQTSSKNSNEETSSFTEISDGIKDLCSDPNNNPCEYRSERYLSGYTYWVSVLKEGREGSSDFEQKIDILSKKWIDNQTRSIIVDFVLYNPYVELYTYSKLTLEFADTGTVNTNMQFEHLGRNYYKTSGVHLFRAICEVVFLIFLFVFVIWQPVLMYRTYKEVKSYLEEKELSREKYKRIFIEEVNGVHENKIGKMIWNKVKLVLLVLYTHFTSIWNLLNLTCIVLSVVACVHWVMLIAHYNSFDITPDILNNQVKSRDINDNILYAANLLYTCQTLCSFNLIFIFIRILKCLIYFSPRVSVLFGALNKAKYDIFYFLIIMVTVLLGFVMFIYFYFGPTNHSYSHITKVIVNVVQLMNIHYNIFDNFIRESPILGSILTITFKIVISFIFVNMFVGFLRRGYKEANQELIYERTGRDKKGRKIRYFIEVHFVNRIRDIIYTTLGTVSKRYKTKSLQIENDRKKYTAILQQTKNEQRIFDITFNPIRSLTQEKSKIPFTSHFAEARANNLRDKRCGWFFYSTLSFFLFIALFVVQLTLQLKISYGNDIVLANKKRIIENTKLRFDKSASHYENYFQQSCEDYTEGDIYSFNDIINFNYLKHWIKCGFYQLYEEKEKYYHYNHIIDSQFIVTFRRGKKLPVSSVLDKNYYKISHESDLYQRSILGEEKDTININSRTYTYSPTNGYLNKGGYIFYWKVDSTLKKNIHNFIDDRLINCELWVLAIEFATYEVNSKAHVYHGITFVMTDRGSIIKKIDTFPLYVVDFSKGRGGCMVFLNVVIMLFLVYYAMSYVYGFISRWRDYSAWIKSELPHFSNMEIFQRNEKRPEILRQLNYVFSLYRILDIVFLVFAFMSITYWILYSMRTRAFNKALNDDGTFSTEHLNDMRTAYDYLLNYIDYSAIALILFSVRVSEYLQYSGTMRILALTINRALKDIFYFFVIFMILMIGFAGMATLAFSEVEIRFSTLGDSLITCFILIISGLDMERIYKERGIRLLLFLPFFIILFTYILLSILLAILEINFSLAKVEMSKRDEKVRKLKALICCCLKLPEQTTFNEEAQCEVTCLHSALKLLGNMNINLEFKNKLIRFWAEELGEQIYNERSGRRAFRRQILGTIYKVPVDNVTNELKRNARNAIKERKEYFHYMRIATQFFDYQVTAILYKIKDVEKEIREKYSKYMENKEYYFKGEKIKKIVDKKLNQRFKEIRIKTLQTKGIMNDNNSQDLGTIPRNN